MHNIFESFRNNPQGRITVHSPSNTSLPSSLCVRLLKQRDDVLAHLNETVLNPQYIYLMQDKTTVREKYQPLHRIYPFIELSYCLEAV